MSNSTETVQSYWDARSDLFGNYYKKPSWFDRTFRKAIFQRVAIAVRVCKGLKRPTVLDVGSGPGINSHSIIKNTSTEKLTGIDFSQQMIDYANANAREEGIAGKCEFVLGDAMTYDFKGKKFDFAMALGVFDYVEDAAGLMKRMSDLTTQAFVASWPENGVRMMLRRRRYTCSLHHYTAADIQKLHEKAGITKLEIIRIGAGWVSVARK